MNSFPIYVSGDSVVSREHKFVWYCVPKAATRTMLRVFTGPSSQAFKCDKFAALDGFKKYNFLGFSNFDIDDYFKFSFVRNPFTRVASFWYEKFLNYDDSAAKQQMFSMHEGIHPTMNFSDFVTWLSGPNGEDKSADPHWRSQNNFIMDKEGHLLVDFIGKLETFEQDVARLWQLKQLPEVTFLNLNNNGERINLSNKKLKSKKNVYCDLFTERTEQIIRERYAKDFELFGYEKSFLEAITTT